MAVRLSDIARDLGVSTVTVSKVLRGKGDISKRTRALVLKRMKELNYKPNILARGLASGRSYAIGLVVPDLVHPFFGELAKSLGGALRESGLALLISSSEEDPEIEQREIRSLLDRGVDALLVASCQSPTLAKKFFRSEQTPLLFVDRNFPALAKDFVGSNDILVGEVATRHLVEIGRRRIAHIGTQDISTSVDRLRGYRLALADAGLSVHKDYVVTRARFEEKGDSAGFQAMQKLLRLKQKPDAVFCYNDLSAIGAMEAAMQAGLSIPRDIAFVGCGNLRYDRYLKVPLSSVDHSTEQMGQLAAKLALDLVANPAQPPQTIQLPPKLIVRQSSVASRHSRS